MRKLAAALALFLCTVSYADTGAWQKVAFTAQTTTVQTVKNVPGVLGGFSISNVANAAASSCVQVFDTAGSVTLGTTVPTMVYEVAGGAAVNLEISQGVSMVNGIKFAVATTCTGNTAPGSGLNITFYFK